MDELFEIEGEVQKVPHDDFWVLGHDCDKLIREVEDNKNYQRFRTKCVKIEQEKCASIKEVAEEEILNQLQVEMKQEIDRLVHTGTHIMLFVCLFVNAAAFPFNRSRDHLRLSTYQCWA